MKMAMIYLSNYNDWPLGGMLSYIRNIIPGMVKNNIFEIDIWGGQKDNENCDYFIINESKYDLKIYTKFYTYKKILPNFVVSFLNIFWKKKKLRNYDIFYSHTSATTIALKIMFPNRCVIHHQHGLSYKKNKGVTRILNIGYTIAQILSDATLFVASEQEVEKHRKSRSIFRNKHFYSIGSPIDFKRISICSQNRSFVKHPAQRYLYTGRIDAWKNIDLLIDSFQIYLNRYNSAAKLIIIGVGPQFDLIYRKICDMNLEKSVKLAGRKSHEEIISYLSQSDVFLFPTKGEGVSLSLLEAFSAGVPAVSFDVIGVRNYVFEGETGVVVRNMTAESYAEGIRRIDSIYETMRTKCKEIASDYDSEKIVSKIESIIQYEVECFYKKRKRE